MQENPAISLWNFWHMTQRFRNPGGLARLRKDSLDRYPASVREADSYTDPWRNRRHGVYYLNSNGVPLDYRCYIHPFSLVEPEEGLFDDIDAWQPVYRLYQNGTPVFSLWPNGDFIMHSHEVANTLFKHTFFSYGYAARRKCVTIDSVESPYSRIIASDYKTRRWYMEFDALYTDIRYHLKLTRLGWEVAVTVTGEKREMWAKEALERTNQKRERRYQRYERKSPSYRPPSTTLTQQALPEAIRSIKVYEPTNVG